jgi:hypothetical protein
MITRVRDTGYPLSRAGQFEYDVDLTSGTTFQVKAGSVSKSGVRTDVAAGSVALGDGINWVYVDISGTPALAAAASHPGQREVILLYIVTVSGSIIQQVDDVRNWLTSSTIVV